MEVGVSVRQGLTREGEATPVNMLAESPPSTVAWVFTRENPTNTPARPNINTQKTGH